MYSRRTTLRSAASKAVGELLSTCVTEVTAAGARCVLSADIPSDLIGNGLDSLM